MTDRQPRCATCLWYQPNPAGHGMGLCMHAPPVIQVVMPPPTAIGAQPRSAVQGLRPPTSENDRCEHHQTLIEWLAHDRQCADHVGAGTA